MSIQIHGQNELDLVSFWQNRQTNKQKTNKQTNKQTNQKNVCFQGSHFVCLGEARVMVRVICELCWVCGCVNEVCMEVTGCGDGCVGVGVGECFGKILFNWWFFYPFDLKALRSSITLFQMLASLLFVTSCYVIMDMISPLPEPYKTKENVTNCNQPKQNYEFEARRWVVGCAGWPQVTSTADVLTEH